MKKRIGNKNIAKAGKKTQFPKGVSGNPKGKPPGISITQYIRDMSDEEIDMAIKNSAGQTIRVERHTRAKALVNRMFDLAMRGSERAASKYMEIILERAEGKVSQPIEVKSKLDLSKLSKQELELLKLIHSKAATE